MTAFLEMIVNNKLIYIADQQLILLLLFSYYH